MLITFRIFIVKINLLQNAASVCSFYATLAKNLDICKQLKKNLINKRGYVPRRGVMPKFYAPSHPLAKCVAAACSWFF